MQTLYKKHGGGGGGAIEERKDLAKKSVESMTITLQECGKASFLLASRIVEEKGVSISCSEIKSNIYDYAASMHAKSFHSMSKYSTYLEEEKRKERIYIVVKNPSTLRLIDDRSFGNSRTQH